MASFDIINAAGNAYTLAWKERPYLLRLAAFPVIIKFVSMVVLMALGLEAVSPLRSSLVLLPAYFAEGWMLAHIVRLVILEQYWPFRPSGDDEKDMAALSDRARGILSGMVVFVLIQMIITLMWTGGLAIPMEEEALAAPDLQTQLMSVAILVFMLWVFRYLWIFIPLAVNYSALDFLKDVSHPKLSLYMVGVWLICAVPGMLVMVFVSMPVLIGGDEMPAVARFIAAALHVVMQVSVNVLATAGIAYGLKDMYARQKGGS